MIRGVQKLIGSKTFNLQINLQLIDYPAINLQLIGKVKLRIAINCHLIGGSNGRQLSLCARDFRSRNDGSLSRKVASPDSLVPNSFDSRSPILDVGRRNAGFYVNTFEFFSSIFLILSHCSKATL